MPKGIYLQKQKMTIEGGDIVAVCLPIELRRFALNRGYISKGIYCQGTMPLIKKIMVVPGDKVLVRDDTIAVNHKSFVLKKFKTDSLGRQLLPYPNGNYIANGFWLLGTDNERSWDSRYFGEIKSSNILCVLRPIFVWE